MEGYSYSPRLFDTNYALTSDYLEASLAADGDTGHDERLHEVPRHTDPSSGTGDAREVKGFSHNDIIPAFDSSLVDYTKTTSSMGFPGLGTLDLAACQNSYGASSGDIWPGQDTSLPTSPMPTPEYTHSSYLPTWPLDNSLDVGCQLTNIHPGSNTSPRSDSDDSTDDTSTRCWEHGCNGRRFSTRGNLVRHQKEKAKREVKAYCFNCGAFFTRTTARDKHVINQSCGRIRRYSNGRIRPLFARSMGLSDVTSCSNAASGALSAFMEDDLIRNDQVRRSPEWLELARR
ncbi:hypothetical protein GGR54DRAFT_271352 [Hypoxylon sp. NC1633]|nr:hypothetical protein GGR54DRAFT_271352 [Hypoxylon sp. NC1633]